MKKFLLPAALFLLFPLVAGAVTPKPGHYQGVATISSGGIHRTIAFDLTASDGHYYVRHFRLTPNTFHQSTLHIGGFAQDEHKFTFNVHDIADIQFKGHGVWEQDNRVAGDFREHVGHSPHNSYYTWNAHWRHI